MIGLALEGEVDFAMSHFGLRPDRFTVMNFIMVSKGGAGRIYVKNPKDSFHWTIYAEPLTLNAWIYVAIFLAFIPILMRVSVHSGKDPSFSKCFIICDKSLLIVLKCSHISIDS